MSGEYNCSYCNKNHESLDNHYYKDTKHFDFEFTNENDYRSGYDLAYHRVLKLEQIIEKQKECLIFYSDLEDYEDSHEQLDWSRVNNPSAIQDKGKRARQCLKEVEELCK